MILAAQSKGDGPRTLVLLHGLFGQARNLGVIAREFAPRFRVISLDLRNHGASPHSWDMDYATLAADVWETLEALGVTECSLLGHSMGGKAAMMAALLRPTAVQALVVIDIAPKLYQHHNDRVARAMQALALDRPMIRRDADAVLAPEIPDAGTRRFLLQNFIAGDQPGWGIGLDEIALGISDIEGWPADSATKRFDGPSMFVGGALSDYVAAEDLPLMRRFFPRAELVMVEGAGHWVHADRPQELLEILQGFLSYTNPPKE